MENATKALLIAAAVLIAVLIISLGVIVYNKASEAVTGAGDLSEYQTQQFNEKFTKYQSENATGADVNAMLTTVFNHNNSQPDGDTCVKVTVDGTDRISANNELEQTPTKVSTGARYKIVCKVDPKSKLVNEITVTKNTSTPSTPTT